MGNEMKPRGLRLKLMQNLNRHTKGMKQQELADILDVSQGRISQLRSEATGLFTVDYLLRLHKRLGIEYKFILDGEEVK